MTLPVVQLIDEPDPFGSDEPLFHALTAAGGPMEPPDEWFDDPDLDRPTPQTITADGRLYGHIAPWSVRHVGMNGNVKPPKSRSKYAYFNLKPVRASSGNDVLCGNLTLVGGHAHITADASQAVRHYDDTRSAIADIRIGEDRHGIWAAGAVRPDVTPLQLRALRASVPSGDWRPINGALELIAVCQVNSPGFPTAHALVASGELSALVAAGASDMYRLKIEQAMGYDDRLAELEALVASLRHMTMQSLRDRVTAARRS